MKRCGVYIIKNKINNKSYIGSSINIIKRKNTHFLYLHKNIHPNKHLQSSYNKYGKDEFEFHILEENLSEENLLSKEQHYIDTLKPEYNKRLIASSNLGCKMVRTVSSDGDKNNFFGKKHSIHAKLLMRLAKLGKKSNKSIFPGKSISKYSLDNEFIEKYSTLKEASIKNNLPYKWFIETIKKNEEYKGFLWKKE